jgi:hypothetical protein
MMAVYRAGLIAAVFFDSVLSAYTTEGWAMLTRCRVGLQANFFWAKRGASVDWCWGCDE